jgi:O-antigen/teichoic acid export membrane protein
MQGRIANVSRAFFFQLALGYGNFFIAIASTFILIPIYLTIFGLSEYGIWLAFNSIVGLSAFITLNAGSIIIKAITENFDNTDKIKYFLVKIKKYYFYNILILISFLLLSLIMLIQDQPQTISKEFLIISSIFIAVINLLNEYVRSILIGTLNLQNFTFFSILGKLITFALTLYLLKFQSIIIIPISIILGELFIFFSALFFVRKFLFNTNDLEYFEEDKFNLKVILSNAVGTSSEIFTKNAEYPLINYTFGPDVLAGYSIVRKLADMLGSLITTLLSSTIASASKAIKNFSSLRLKDFSHDYLFLFIFLTSSLMIFYLNALPYFLDFWLGNENASILDLNLSSVISLAIFFWIISNTSMTLYTINGNFIRRAQLSILGFSVYIFTIFTINTFFSWSLDLIVISHIIVYSLLLILSVISHGIFFTKKSFKLFSVLFLYLLTLNYFITYLSTSFYINNVDIKFLSLLNVIIYGLITCIAFWITIHNILKLDWVLPYNLKEIK